MSEVPHSIRLNGPWQATFASQDEPTRLQLPRDWSTLPAACASDVKLTRAFHAPTGINPKDEILLVLDELPLTGQVSLNGQPLGNVTRSERFAIADRLNQRNQIEIIGQPLNPGNRPGEVRLEI
ncbi:MAG: hypothetical protein ACIALR_03360, partial [Blastopirellula sp. JB062]